ncbi:hypothetical protein IBL99_002922 [Listeria monocytogenes]|uniref:hypothetical protein n=1 Tax=Listeria monocytogenes TaxID=1639 RepID=UPI0010B0F03A|nr:hypothetical protein [Listeria monocytogenes]EAC3456895.1 hypothetical protein [Listeria monocytogenes]EAC4365877.1 hypothetical protein [Listeria monocytogenes]EAC4831169.1 hypothetical protein [Listeria monocytogenes]EAC6175398.1 hypothetical protein [Listeria monocytogenes]EAC7892621.1 hypothetical protein [Listeria monocytogenes]
MKRIILTSALIVWSIVCIYMSISMISNNTGIAFPVWLHTILLICFLATGILNVKMKEYLWSVMLFEGVLVVLLSLIIILM